MVLAQMRAEEIRSWPQSRWMSTLLSSVRISARWDFIMHFLYNAFFVLKIFFDLYHWKKIVSNYYLSQYGKKGALPLSTNWFTPLRRQPGMPSTGQFCRTLLSLQQSRWNCRCFQADPTCVAITWTQESFPLYPLRFLMIFIHLHDKGYFIEQRMWM